MLECLAGAAAFRRGRSLVWCLGNGYTTLRNMRPLRFDVNRVERLAGGHKQAVAFLAAETDVGANLRQQNHPDPLAVGRKNMHAVVPGPPPARRGPAVPTHVAGDPVGPAIAA